MFKSKTTDDIQGQPETSLSVPLLCLYYLDENGHHLMYKCIGGHARQGIGGFGLAPSETTWCNASTYEHRKLVTEEIPWSSGPLHWRQTISLSSHSRGRLFRRLMSQRTCTTHNWQQKQHIVKTKVFLVEVGCSWFVVYSTIRLLRDLGKL